MLVDAIQPVLQAAAGQREFVLYGAIAVGAIALIQAFLACWTIFRLRELARMRERMSRLADGLALLTDTTESGLTAISRQIDQLARRPVVAPAPAPRTTSRSTSRSTVAKRVVAAAQQGGAVANIADKEEMSESEVRLHLALAQVNARKELR
jgi:hypothetical protein